MSEAQTPGAGKSDMPPQSWLDLMPAAARPYLRLMRLDRPIGIWLLVLPCWWGLALAGGGDGEWRLALLFAMGSVVMRGAGCTYNDIVDRDIDAKVARTATRPLPAGQVSVTAAWAFLGVQLLAGLIILLQLNGMAVFISILSLALVASYPFMKRITYWPQLWLGLTFNWGVLVAWAAAQNAIALPAVILYAAGVVWTLGYDTIYAHQDKEDDAMIGVKSAALALDGRTAPFVGACYTLTVALILAAAAAATTVTIPFLIVLGLGAFQLFRQVKTLDIDDPVNCLERFRSNRDFGLFVLLALMLLRP